MKEILISAVAIMIIFGLAIYKMMADIIATCIEKPRWKMQSVRIEMD
jgi:uncharacterized membrane protein